MTDRPLLPLLPVQRDLSAVIADALERGVAAGELSIEGPLPAPAMERPRVAEHGDWSTNVALQLAKPARMSPRAVASALVARLEVPDWVEGVDIAGPGFVNIRLAHRWFEDLVRQVVAEGTSFGRSAAGSGRRVQVEWISANPTGPLHVGNARLAPVGDALANLLDAAGYDVSREYYINDAGSQMDLLGASVEAAYLAAAGRPAEPPEDGYKGAYITEMAKVLFAEQGEALAGSDPAARRERITEWSYARFLSEIQRTLERYRVFFDVWFSERTLHESGAIGETVAELRRRGAVYDADGAVWLRSSEFGDDRDRPLIRSTGAPTYFGVDAAYFENKRRRGFDKVIYLWGADHHGYVARMQAIVRALGSSDDAAEFILGQLLTISRGGKLVRMSKRTGDFITIDELLDEVGVDAARYEMVRYSFDAPMEFDIEAVTRQSLENPVYYVQYAHARVSGVLRQAGEVGFRPAPAAEADLSLLGHPQEQALLRELSVYPELLLVATAQRAPHRIPRYVEGLAAAFHRFYGECRVLTDDVALSSARYWLCVATRQILANALGLLGVTAPERM